jgi:hypothetical protein
MHNAKMAFIHIGIHSNAYCPILVANVDPKRRMMGNLDILQISYFIDSIKRSDIS